MLKIALSLQTSWENREERGRPKKGARQKVCISLGTSSQKWDVRNIVFISFLKRFEMKQWEPKKDSKMAPRAPWRLPKMTISLGTSSKNEQIQPHRFKNCCSNIVLESLLKRLLDGPSQPSKNDDFARDILKKSMCLTSRCNDFQGHQEGPREPQTSSNMTPRSALETSQNGDFAWDILTKMACSQHRFYQK